MGGHLTGSTWAPCQQSYAPGLSVSSLFTQVSTTLRPQEALDHRTGLVATAQEAFSSPGAPLPHNGPLASIGNSHRASKKCTDTHFNCSYTGGKTHLRQKQATLLTESEVAGYLENTQKVTQTRLLFACSQGHAQASSC